MFHFSHLKFDRATIKKFAIVLVAAAIVVCGILFVDWLSYKNVVFNLSSETKSITVYDADQYEFYSASNDARQPIQGAIESNWPVAFESWRLLCGADWRHYFASMRSRCRLMMSGTSVDIKPY